MMLEGSFTEDLSHMQNKKTCRTPHIQEYPVPQEKDGSMMW